MMFDQFEFAFGLIMQVEDVYVRRSVLVPIILIIAKPAVSLFFPAR